MIKIISEDQKMRQRYQVTTSKNNMDQNLLIPIYNYFSKFTKKFNNKSSEIQASQPKSFTMQKKKKSYNLHAEHKQKFRLLKRTCAK